MKDLTMVCDAKAHYVKSGSSDTNPKGGITMNYMVIKTCNINTFAFAIRLITGLALGHNELEKLVTNGMYLMKKLCQVTNMCGMPSNCQSCFD